MLEEILKIRRNDIHTGPDPQEGMKGTRTAKNAQDYYLPQALSVLFTYFWVLFFSFYFYFERGSHNVSQADLELTTQSMMALNS